MPAGPVSRPVLVALELLCGFAMGSILMTILHNAINPLIIFLIIIATIIAILDFADYLPAFSLAYFLGYLLEFLYPVDLFGDLKLPVFVIALAGICFVVAVKARTRGDRHPEL